MIFTKINSMADFTFPVCAVIENSQYQIHTPYFYMTVCTTFLTSMNAGDGSVMHELKALEESVVRLSLHKSDSVERVKKVLD